MRCLILITICISSAFAFYDSSTYSKYLPIASKANFPNMQLHMGHTQARTKRDIRVHELDDPNDCLYNCTQGLHDHLGDVNETGSESDNAKLLCKALQPMEQCYKSCPDSQFRKLMLDFLPVMKQPCILGTDKFDELQKTLTCSNATSDLISDKCDPICNKSFAGDLRLESRVVLNIDPAFVLYDDDKQENTAVLKSTCKFILCQQQCGDAVLKEKCGQMALDVDHKITSSIFGSIINLYKDLQAVNGEINECKAIL